MSFARQQLIGIAGALPAFAVVFLTGCYAPSFFGAVALPADNSADRIAFALRWLIVPGLTLLVGIWIAGRRGFMPNAIDGTRTPTSHSFEINLRYNQNTLEQVVLAAIAWMNLSISLPRGRLVLIPAMAFLFGVGRAAFWIGYMISPMGRAFGMVLTVLPTIAAYLWLLAHIAGRA
jgi:hypothetical protein